MFNKHLRRLCFKFRRFLIWFWEQEGTPGERARGLAVGIFSGCFPFFGLQTFIGIALARLLKGNLLLAAAGTWISNPATYLPLYFFNFKVGSLILSNNEAYQNIDFFVYNKFFNQSWLVMVNIFVGSIAVGGLAACFFGCLTYYILRKGLSGKFKKDLTEK